MTRELKIVVHCDGEDCERTIGDEQHPGAMEIEINGGGVRQIDLCASCMAVYGRLRSLYDSAPKVPSTAKAKAANVECPAPGCRVKSPTPQGIGRHTRSAHGKSVKEIRAEERAA